MTSLGETYQGRDGMKKRPRRLYAGVGLFAVGSLLTVVAIVAATTDLFSPVGLDLYGSRKLAGVTAGLGVPAVFVGIFTVLPTRSDRIHAAAAIGSSISILGVGMFWYAYPYHWKEFGRQLMLPVIAVYFAGLLITFGCLFVAVVNFTTRNDPGGTVTMEVTRKGETKVVEVERDRGGIGGIGVFGDEPDGDIDAAGADGAIADAADSAIVDGGTEDERLSSPIDPNSDRTPASPASPTDTYCGNCTHFEYVRTDDGMTPYCVLHDEKMADMDACEQWEANR